MPSPTDDYLGEDLFPHSGIEMLRFVGVFDYISACCAGAICTRSYYYATRLEDPWGTLSEIAIPYDVGYWGHCAACHEPIRTFRDLVNLNTEEQS